jgi:hypothetical protein
VVLHSRTVLLGGLTILASWLGMMVVHEAGHVIHAWVSGGSVVRVVLNPLSFSRTDLSSNPYPLFVAWGGAVWGSAIPLLLWFMLRRHPLGFLARFFAGFCLIANGMYLAAGAAIPVGDVEEMLRLGCPRSVPVAAGLPLVITGLVCWNGLDRSFGMGTQRAPSGAMTAAAIAAAGLLTAMTAWTVLV